MARRGIGGRGGNAYVDGDNSTAEGGQGGGAVVGDGGRGGDASVNGDNAHAIGGRGGRGGIGPGGRGGDANVVRDQTGLERLPLTRGQEDAEAGPGRGGSGYAVAERAFEILVAGGQGGEANQPDGRGGRGGRAFIPPELQEHLALPDRSHMRWPYFEPITEPGRGGDAPDTPRYKARRIIVEQLKRLYFGAKGLHLADAWWDRTVVPMDWLNEKLRGAGHRWQASIIDDEYEFTDLPKYL
jgi:hypothetical protein